MVISINNKQQGGELCFLWKRKSCKEGKCQKMAFRKYDENLKNKFSCQSVFGYEKEHPFFCIHITVKYI